jgi:glycosyltransferase involved in cell wall biosynthesis
MKIVILADSFRPEGGGSERLAFELVQNLSRKNIPLTLVSGQSLPAELNGAGHAISLGQKPLLKTKAREALLRGLYNPAARAAVGTLIAERDDSETVYIVNSWFQILSPSIFGALTAVAPRVLVFAHDYFLACPNGAFFDYGKEEPCARVPLSLSCMATQCDKRSYVQKLWRSGVAFMRRLSWNVARNGSKVIAVHEGMIPFLSAAGIPPKSILVVRNPSEPFTQDRVPAEKNREILFVGTLTRQKGFDVLIEALSERPYTLNIFGAGDVPVPPLPNLRLHGFQPHEVIRQAAERSRVLVLPSRQRETFGLVAVEAIGSGLPVILSDQALLAADVRKHQCGSVIPAVTKQHILDAIDQMFADDDLAATFSRNAMAACRAISPTHADWTRHLIALCHEAIEGDGPKIPA